MNLALRSISFVLVLSVIIGCGSSDGPAIADVTGTILHKGAPVSGAVIEFFPENGRPSMGITNEKGKYVLYYNVGETGAKIGLHTIMLTGGQAALPSTANKSSSPSGNKIPGPPAGQSSLELAKGFEVKAGTNTFDFDLAKLK